MNWTIDLKSPPKSRIKESPLGFSVEELASNVATGLFLEFGVFSGKSINMMARILHEHSDLECHGFDTFEGLPEHWRENYKEGTFDLKGEFPEVRDNVRLYKGLFQDTLGPFLEVHKGEKCSLVHLDGK